MELETKNVELQGKSSKKQEKGVKKRKARTTKKDKETKGRNSKKPNMNKNPEPITKEKLQEIENIRKIITEAMFQKPIKSESFVLDLKPIIPLKPLTKTMHTNITMSMDIGQI